MAARYLAVCLVALTYFLLVAGSSFDDIDDAVDVVEKTCPAGHETAIKVCQFLIASFYIGDEWEFEKKNSRKANCCFRLASHHCTELVAKAYCSEDDQDTASVDDFFKNIISGDQCQDYQEVGQCNHPVFIFLEFFLIFLSLICVFTFVVCVVFNC